MNRYWNIFTLSIPAVTSQIINSATKNNSFSPPDNSRIVYGQIAEYPEQYEFLVSIRMDLLPESNICAGTIINPYTIISAAHCNESSGFEGLVAYYKFYDFSDLESIEEAETYEIVDFVQHPDYNPSKYFNDIAVLRVEQPIPISSSITLDDGKIGQDFLHEVRVVGWGLYGEGPTVTSPVLRKADLQIGDSNVCVLYMKWLAQVTVNPKMHICALQIGGRGDACQGDSGGPLLARVCGVWVLVGIVSYGEECGLATAPGIYTKVSNYLDFIRENAFSESSPPID